MKVNAIIQARCGSSRLPRKIFAQIDEKPLIWHVVNRLTYAKTIDNIVLATTVKSDDDIVEKWCRENGVACYRGSENDVLNRYYEASKKFPSDVIVRITADDPFKEPSVIDKVVSSLVSGEYDYVTNNFPPTYPEGLDCEAFTSETLNTMEKLSKDDFEREHVTQYVYHHTDKFRIMNVLNERNLSYLRWTIDEEADIDMVRAIYKNRETGRTGILLMDEILEILKKNQDIGKINTNIKRSSMY